MTTVIRKLVTEKKQIHAIYARIFSSNFQALFMSIRLENTEFYRRLVLKSSVATLKKMGVPTKPPESIIYTFTV